jgi:hypothetical protein
MILYHGSVEKFKIGDVLIPNKEGYTHSKNVTELELLFEKEKPSFIKYSRLNCVFLCDNEEDIDNCGGYTDYIYVIDIQSLHYEKSDLSWYTKAGFQREENDFEAAKKSARNYWNGIILEGVFEYRTKEVTIINEV